MSQSEQGDILIRELFAGEVTEERFNDLEEWLRADPENMKLLAEVAITERLLFVEQKQLDASAILALLLEAEENAEPIMVSIPQANQTSDRQPNETDTPLSFKQAASAIGYLLSHNTRKYPKHVAGIAAALALSLVLLGALLIGSLQSPESEPIASDSTLTPPNSVSKNESVATLTGEQGAQWRAVSGTVLPDVGAGLQSGQRLTLIDGFAEITTKRGAVAMIQAPCTFELTGDNSLYLLTGKMLGICETPSSKGFSVRTPWINVIDLGTRFGIDATEDGSTQVQVFEGEVIVAAPTEETDTDTNQVLIAGQATTAREDGLEPTSSATDNQAFASLQSAVEFSELQSAGFTGVRRISGDLKLSYWQEYIGQPDTNWGSSDKAVIFNDYTGRLKKDIRVNVAQPGQYAKLEETTGTMIASGMKVRSFVIFKTANPTDEVTKVHGNVTFDSEVIGIITDQMTADLFASSIDTAATIFSPQPGDQRWIDINSFEEGFSLSEDRRTVAFDFQVKQSTDMIRVLVQAKQE